MNASDADAFELKRMMRQEAHEKAFEFNVMGQRQYESEKQRLFAVGKERLDKEHKEKLDKINIDCKIQQSKKANETRIMRMKCRNEQLTKLKELVKERILSDLASDTDLYRETLKKMIIQGMIKLLEDRITLICREGEEGMVQDLVEECQNEYAEIMQRETQREYQTELVVATDRFLTEEEGAEYGGVIMRAYNNRIVVSNTLKDRMELVFETALPAIRANLFPKK